MRLPLLALSMILLPAIATAQVNWSETLGYQKPRPYPVSMPDEAAVANKYWVNMSSGSGSTCSQASPCANITAVSGKTGTSGGPAIIYLKGNGRLNITGGTLAGSSGNEIVVKPWPGDSTPAVMTAQSGCNIGDANTISGSGTHHVIFDGGPDMLLRFRGSGCTSNQNGYSVVVNSNDITFYRVRIDANGSAGPALGIATGNGVSTARFKFINSELYGASRYYGVYTGGGATCCSGSSSHTNIEFRNSIFRNIDGRGIQVEPRSNSSGVVIDSCVFRNIGKNSSGTSSISAAIQPADACCGSTSGIVISNNLFWDLGGGAVHSGGSHSGLKIVNNTVYDYGKNGLVVPQSRGFSCYSSGCSAEADNNILLSKPSNVEPFHPNTSSWTNGSTNNICESGQPCGNSKVNGTTASTFLSTSTSSRDFLKPGASSPSVNAGTNTSGITSDAARDYTGKSRPIGASYDIGAFEYGTGDPATRPNPPTVN